MALLTVWAGTAVAWSVGLSMTPNAGAFPPGPGPALSEQRPVAAGPAWRRLVPGLGVGQISRPGAGRFDGGRLGVRRSGCEMVFVAV